MRGTSGTEKRDLRYRGEGPQIQRRGNSGTGERDLQCRGEGPEAQKRGT